MDDFTKIIKCGRCGARMYAYVGQNSVKCTDCGNVASKK